MIGNASGDVPGRIQELDGRNAVRGDGQLQARDPGRIAQNHCRVSRRRLADEHSGKGMSMGGISAQRGIAFGRTRLVPQIYRNRIAGLI